ncbi:type II toxin-antitoxin system PemK/MazF family toxin [Nocardioides sp. CFH 31398]|uniref:type II toxin-antitoxin system PemK/MazF family toxin n=1 Tax=Nocardioides sp. CFH 31398 TaxID=2919579 RepID=UPI001F063B22|nr:type II toxin-antitoxin system PemK/MazF family toxin [Nocardioides sp. CFH 31398]MCH1866403.1 type II toxin-antitoxin system PemK/MazF family toxin [Nocardioides sp. CFH 31398]
MSLLDRALRLARTHGPTVAPLVRKGIRAAQSRTAGQGGPRRTSRPPARATRPAHDGGVSYAPEVDGQPDPGEVVWGYVPYEDDPSQGKDRPVLLLGERDGRWLGLYLTSKDHDRDAADEARWGRHWMDVGTGAWDSRRRPSEVRLDRLVVLDAGAIRREGAALPRPVYDVVVARARELGTV